MDIQTVVFGLSSFFHNLFTVIWLGGLLVAVLSFLPALKGALGPGPQVKKVMAAYQKRQSSWVYASMAGLILTGLIMNQRSPQFTTLFGFGNPYSTLLSIKHILVILMIGVTIYRSRVLAHSAAGLTPQEEHLNLRLLLVNAVLAVLVLLASGGIDALA